MKIQVLLFFGIALTEKNVKSQYAGRECFIPSSRTYGICKNIYECPEIRNLYQQGHRYTICSSISGDHVICCPTQQVQQQQTQNNQQQQFVVNKRGQFNSRISITKCQEYSSILKKKFTVSTLSVNSNRRNVDVTNCDVSSQGLVVGGVAAKKGEFPHMAAIGYIVLNGVVFKCGGTLISNQFVLTAAHCRKKNLIPVLVRLGNHNIAGRHEDNHLDITISDFIVHENYMRQKKRNDIALIRMQRAIAEFTKFIRPACLWQNDYINTSKTIATGWGFTEDHGNGSDVLMKVELDIIDNNWCTDTWKNSDVEITSTQLCAGVLTGGKDTCQGDSGGPIQVMFPENRCIYYIIGLTSFGQACGSVGIPSIYTRVSSYIDWIESKVWN